MIAVIVDAVVASCLRAMVVVSAVIAVIVNAAFGPKFLCQAQQVGESGGRGVLCAMALLVPIPGCLGLLFAADGDSAHDRTVLELLQPRLVVNLTTYRGLATGMGNGNLFFGVSMLREASVGASGRLSAFPFPWLRFFEVGGVGQLEDRVWEDNIFATSCLTLRGYFAWMWGGYCALSEGLPPHGHVHCGNQGARREHL